MRNRYAIARAPRSQEEFLHLRRRASGIGTGSDPTPRGSIRAAPQIPVPARSADPWPLVHRITRARRDRTPCKRIAARAP